MSWRFLLFIGMVYMCHTSSKQDSHKLPPGDDKSTLLTYSLVLSVYSCEETCDPGWN